MKNSGQPLDDLWRRIDMGLAGEQERIDAAFSSGTSDDTAYVPKLLGLLEDESGLVRHYALQSLVLDLQQKDDAMRARCWRILREDPSEEADDGGHVLGKHVFWNQFACGL
ncbi:MAG: hypothetical protein M3O15_08065 [Acidobacteriota bacterium]|nr:hypothetical protein [Acidobacteriota bacterium]